MSAMKLSCFVLAATHGMVGAAIVSQLRGSNMHASWKVAGAVLPTAVAKKLPKEESELRSQALRFVECNADPNHGNCEPFAGTFQKSCGTVVNDVVAASNGDRETVRAYMGVVCNRLRAFSWKKGCCQNFAQAVLDTVTANDHTNRVHLYEKGLCAHFWKNMSSDITAEEHQLQEKQIEVEKAKRAREAAKAAAADAALKKLVAEAKLKEAARERAQEAAEVAAADAKRARDAAEAAAADAALKKSVAKAKLMVAARQHAREAAKAAAADAKRARDASEAAAADAALKKSAAEAKLKKAARERAREAAEAAAADAERARDASEAAAADSARYSWGHIKRQIREMRHKAVIVLAQPTKAGSGTRTPTHAKTASPVAKKASNNSKNAAANAMQTSPKKTVATNKQPSKQVA